MALPASRLRGWIVGAEDLGAAGDELIAAVGVIRASLFRVDISTCPDEVALADKGRDVARRTVVALDKGGVRVARFRVGEEDATTQ